MGTDWFEESVRKFVGGSWIEQRMGADRKLILTLFVPARPEVLPIVRVVVMSTTAIAGARLDQIYERTHRVMDDFTRVLAREPETRQIVIRTPVDADDVELVAVR